MLLSNSDFESLIGDKVSMPYQLRKSDAAARPHVSVHIAQTVRISQGQSSLSLGKNYAHQAIGAFSECHGVCLTRTFTYYGKYTWCTLLQLQVLIHCPAD